ncbi:MAG: protein kinase [Bryobacteraceae bacterium]
MSIGPRTRIGPYEITGTLGAGGMGEVYRGRDARLNRDVALKVLPPALARDRDRMDRFSREAQLLASLNHPNIASLYGLEESGDIRALVMELVEGPTLAERIERGPMPLDEAVPIARQIAEGLEAAHEKGVIHRDLKPANVKVTPDGIVKILDFGLAKAMDEVEASTPDVNAPTIKHSPTKTGIIMGTAGYMSPEQARGKAVDRRADIWAFGVVVYEMLSGRPLYGGETAPETMAAVILTEPRLESLPANLPGQLRRLLERCLTKDPKQRLRDIGEARILLEEATRNPETVSAAAAPTLAPSKSTWLWPAVSAALAIALIFAAWQLLRPQDPKPVSRFQLHPPAGASFVDQFPPNAVISPDGRKIVFTAKRENQQVQLWVRALESAEPQPIAGTAGAVAPFWSPDSHWIGFFADAKLKKVELGGVSPVTLADAPEGAGAAWLEGDQIVVDHSNLSPLGVVSSSGGSYRPVTSLQNPAGTTSHVNPRPLPGGTHFLFFARSLNPKVQGLYVGSVDGGPAKLVTNEPSTAEYSPVGGGHLLFVRESMLMAQPFDWKSVRLSGEPAPITDGVTAPGARANMSISQSALLYSNGGQVSGQLVTYGRDGKIVTEHNPLAMYDIGSVSPKGDWAAIIVRQIGGNFQLRIVDLVHGVSTSLEENINVTRPLIASQGSQLAYLRGRNLVLRSLSNPSQKPVEWELPPEWKETVLLNDWLQAANEMLVSNSGDLWLMEPVPGGKYKRLTETPGIESGAIFSPNGKWIAYSYREQLSSQTRNIVLQEFDSATKTLGKLYSIGVEEMRRFAHTQWKSDSTEFYYLSSKNQVKAVTIDAARTFPSTTLPIIQEDAIRLIGVSGDGNRFVLARPSRSAVQGINLILNWSGLLKSR